LNDLKTSIVPSTRPLDDEWASRLRLLSYHFTTDRSQERVINFLEEAIREADRSGSQSPVKLAIRRLDKYNFYLNPWFEIIEPTLQRLVHHFPHTIDYISLLLVKRVAM